MDITSTATTAAAAAITCNNNNGNNSSSNTLTKPQETETENLTPTKIQPIKSLTFTNGVLKRHHPHHHGPPVVVSYKECLRNHAATIGGHALDGCGEFMPSPTATATDPTSLKCAACGCHRNFHRREPEDSPPQPQPQPPTTARIEYQPHHRHHPPPPAQPPQQEQLNRSSPNSSSPPPISSAYYPSAPHMLLALSGHHQHHHHHHQGVSGLTGNNENLNINFPSATSTRKRFRTKFTQEQKERMHEFAEKLNWKMQKRDDDLIREFCNEVKVDKGVLKVWMHNNKNTFNKRDSQSQSVNANATTDSNIIRRSTNIDIEGARDHNVMEELDYKEKFNTTTHEDINHHHQQHFKSINIGVGHVGTNGSSSSS